MSTDAELEKIKAQLGNVVRMPEIVFGQNELRLVHLGTGLQIRFCPLDALVDWVSENRAPVQLDISADWKRERRQEIEHHRVQQLQYDWTFTTPYRGTVHPGRFEECGEGLDFGLLQSTDDPILYYDALSLYESELDDTGSCQCKVWIRAMAEYWFLVLRFFLRVDHHLVRLYETRFFSKFSDGVKVLRDVKRWEISFEALREAGASTEMTSYKDAEAVAAVLRSIYPAGLVLDRCEKLLLAGRGADPDASQPKQI